MSRIYTSITIHQPIERVFDYVTTAAHWPKWHQSSLGVSGAVDHSAGVGEQVTEEFLVAGRRGSAVWTVKERHVPTRWVIQGKVGPRGGGIITYTLTAQNKATKFEREFVYWFNNPLYTLLDRFLARPRIAAESIEALNRLKHEMENG